VLQQAYIVLLIFYFQGTPAFAMHHVVPASETDAATDGEDYTAAALQLNNAPQNNSILHVQQNLG